MRYAHTEQESSQKELHLAFVNNYKDLLNGGGRLVNLKGCGYFLVIGLVFDYLANWKWDVLSKFILSFPNLFVFLCFHIQFFILEVDNWSPQTSELVVIVLFWFGGDFLI